MGEIKFLKKADAPDWNYHVATPLLLARGDMFPFDPYANPAGETPPGPDVLALQAEIARLKAMLNEKPAEVTPAMGLPGVPPAEPTVTESEEGTEEEVNSMGGFSVRHCGFGFYKVYDSAGMCVTADRLTRQEADRELQRLTRLS